VDDHPLCVHSLGDLRVTYRRNVDRLASTLPSSRIRSQTVVTRFSPNRWTIFARCRANSTHHTARATALSVSGNRSRTNPAHSSAVSALSRVMPAVSAARAYSRAVLRLSPAGTLNAE